jgi:hypothetical protein
MVKEFFADLKRFLSETGLVIVEKMRQHFRHIRIEYFNNPNAIDFHTDWIIMEHWSPFGYLPVKYINAWDLQPMYPRRKYVLEKVRQIKGIKEYCVKRHDLFLIKDQKYKWFFIKPKILRILRRSRRIESH